MRLQNCFHPNTFKNPYTGEVVTARCGKCDACRNTRSQHWVTRLDLEAAVHKYCYFFTLTYDELHVPQLIRLRNEDYPEKGFAYIDSETGQIIETKDIKVTFEEKDWKFCRESKVVNVLSKRDFQLFIKRLRYYFTEVDKAAVLRYYLCGELGPRTYRPHGHCLLFFDSDRCAQQIEVLLFKSWPHGNIYDPHPVTGSAAEYCASYINSSSVLPKLYLHPQICPFTLCSRNPAIGTLFQTDGEVRKIFDIGDCKFRRYDKITHSFKDEFVFRSFENRLYPRCQRFSTLSHDDRVTLYRLYEDFAKYDLDAVEVAKRIKVEYIDRRGDTFIRRYFREIAYKNLSCMKLQKIEYNPLWHDLPFLPSNLFVEQPFVAQKSHTRQFLFDSIVRFVRSISRLYHQSKIFGISISDYVTKIELYEKNKLRQKLIEDYRYQSEYFSCHPKWHWVYFDLAFYRKIVHSSFLSLSKETLITLHYLFDNEIPLKLVDGISYLDIPDIEDIEEFKNFKFLHRKIAHDLIKQKENNDYALAKKDKFGAIIEFQNI